ncbi:Uncharacterized protein TCM_028131 [Theobroma cacao]|uniref:Uncharacterized protein n=1 Tax=Theobroma cacao TaxID=3641 RepID=A0A061G9A5_THECC|nr:Uncharacterized protein TCM_028131 [Theobroma cacao]
MQLPEGAFDQEAPPVEAEASLALAAGSKKASRFFCKVAIRGWQCAGISSQTTGLESALDPAADKPNVRLSLNKHDKRGKKNRVTGEKNRELTAPAENDETLGQKSVHEDPSENSKNYFPNPPTRVATFMHGDGQLRAESGSGGQNESMDIMEGSGEHRPVVEQGASQTKNTGSAKNTGLIKPMEGKMVLDDAHAGEDEKSAEWKSHAEPLAIVQALVEVDGSKASIVDKVTGPRQMADSEEEEWKPMLKILQIWSPFRVHPRVRHRRYSDTKVSVDKIFNLASDKAVDMEENDEASDEDAISVNFAAS